MSRATLDRNFPCTHILIIYIYIYIVGNISQFSISGANKFFIEKLESRYYQLIAKIHLDKENEGGLKIETCDCILEYLKIIY